MDEQVTNLSVSHSADRQPLGRDVIKKGSLARRQDHASLWKECYVELCPRELCLYSVATGDDSHLCNVYYLSHCQSITLSISHGDHVLEVLFSNGAPLQLQARSREEAEEWRQDLLAQMLALSLPNRTQTPPPTDWHPGTCQVKTIQPAAVQLRPEGTVRIGVLHMLMPQNNWNSYTFVLSQSQLKYFRTNDLQEEPLASYRINQCLNIRFEVTVESTPRLKVSFPEEVLILMADSQQETQEWMEAIKAMINSKRVANSSKCFSVSDQKAKGLDCSDGGTKRNKRYSVTSSFLSLLTVIAVEKGLTAQSFRCAAMTRLPYFVLDRSEYCLMDQACLSLQIFPRCTGDMEQSNYLECSVATRPDPSLRNRGQGVNAKLIAEFKTRGHRYKVRGERFKRDLRGNIFMQRVVRIWNELPGLLISLERDNWWWFNLRVTTPLVMRRVLHGCQDLRRKIEGLLAAAFTSSMRIKL
eukprot:g48389.t1